MGLDLSVENLILYDIPESESLIYQIFLRAMRSIAVAGPSKLVNLITFYDTSKAISSEESRFNKFMTIAIEPGIESSME